MGRLVLNHSTNIEGLIPILKKLNLPFNKAEKDIGIYKTSLTKMEQAKELLEELKIKDKKKDKEN